MDKQKRNISFIAICTVVGFMIAVQFQTVKKPVERDTRDIWQLREGLLVEKELESNLLNEMRSIEEKLDAYDSERKQSKEQALRDTLKELKIEAGLTEVKGPGITLHIEPVLEEVQLGAPINTSVSSELLKKLLNELYMHEAKYVAIDGQRIINTTVIREISSETKIDGHSLTSMPIEVKVAVDDSVTAEKLYNKMKASNAIKEFFMDNLVLSVSEPSQEIIVPAYDNPIRIRYLEPVKENEGGNS